MVGVVLALNAIIEANKEGDFIPFLLCSYVFMFGAVYTVLVY